MYNENNFRGNHQNGQPRVNNNEGVRPTVNNNEMCTGAAVCNSNPFKGALQSAKNNPGKTAAIGGGIIGGVLAIGYVVKNVKNNGVNPKNWTLSGKKKTAKAESAQAAAAAPAEEGKK